MSKVRAEFFETDRLRGLQNLKVDIWKFVKEWNACTLDKKRNSTLLFKYLEPEIDHWVLMLSDPLYPKNINYAVLWSLIDYDDSYLVLSKWAADNKKEIKDIITDIFLSLLRKPPFKINARPKQYIYILTKLLIYDLSHRIRSWYRKNKRILKAEKIYHPVYEETINTDFIHAMIDIERSGPYWYYLTQLFIYDYDKKDFLRITKTTSSLEYFRRKVHEWKD